MDVTVRGRYRRRRPDNVSERPGFCEGFCGGADTVPLPSAAFTGTGSIRSSGDKPLCFS